MPVFCKLIYCLVFIFSTLAHSNDKITLQLKWKHQFQFAGHYAAIEKGFYKEKNLDVHLIEAEATIDPLETVLQNKAEYGIGNSDLLLAKMNGAKIVILATIFQHSPLALMVRQDSKIQTVQELIGKKVMIEPQSAELFAYLKNEGVDPEKIQKIHHTFDTNSLINNQVDAMSVYIVDEPFFLQEAKIPVTFFHPRTGGVDFFGDCLFTTEEEIEKHPERVQAFVEATLKGWDYAFSHEEEMADLILSKYSKRHSRNHLLYEAKKMKELIRPDFIDLGHINSGRWKHIAEVYSGLGILKNMPEDDDWNSFIYNPSTVKTSHFFKIIIITLSSILGVVLIFLLPIFIMNKRLRKEIIEREEIQKRLEGNEKKFRFMVKNSYDIISIIDKNSDISYVSDSVERVTHFKAEQLLGKNFFTYTHPDDSLSIQKTLRQIHSQPGKTLLFELRHQKINHEWAYLEVAGTNFLNDPAIQGIILNIRDMSERKQMETQNAQIQAQLMRNEKLASIGTLAAGIAHEINNPLAIISGYLEIMISDLTGAGNNTPSIDKTLSYIEKQKKAITRMANIVKGLRLSARPDTDDKSLIDFHQVIKETRLIIENTYKILDINFEFELEANSPYIYGNFGKFQQVLMNLLLNAKDAVKDSKKPHVKLSTINKDSKFIFKISDNGHGIKKEEMNKLFLPFYTNKDPDKGTGLGLYIAHTIISAANGHIEVKSDETQGTEFSIELPSGPQYGILNLKEINEPLVNSVSDGFALVIEDEEDLAYLLKKTLENFGLKVTTCSNGLEGLAEIQKRNFDFVFTDMMMPTMNGEEFLNEAEKLELKKTKFIIVTGNIALNEEQLPNSSYHKMIHAYVHKPFTNKDIQNVILKK